MSLRLSPEEFDRIDRILDGVLAVAEEDRERFLSESTGGDAHLELEVRELLAFEVRSRTLFEDSAVEFASPLLEAVRQEEAVPALPPRARIGPYRVEEEVGRGGMGTVYRAERVDEDFAQTVAVKVVKRGMDTEEVLLRFRYERRILASLDHPGIARLLDGGATEDGLPYLVMEFVEGEPLDRHLEREAPPVRERIRLLLHICEAVAHAHRRGVVHRDLKPSNVLVDTGGRPKLLDFGIARLLAADGLDSAFPAPRTRTGRLLFTPEFASPEQLAGEALTPASDVYQLGLLLERALPEAARGGDLRTIVASATAPEPALRYPTAGELAADLGRLLSGHPVHARGPSLPYRIRKWVGRHPTETVAAVLLVLLTGVFAWAHNTRITRERDLARVEAEKAQATTEFIATLFEEADPARSAGDTLSVFQILDRGAERLDTELSGQPMVRAQLQTVVGALYGKLGAFERGEPLLLAAVEAREALHGPDHPEVALALAELGRFHALRADYREADQAFERAQAILESRAGWDAELARVLVGRGGVRAFLAPYEEAEALIRRGMAIEEQLPGDRSARLGDARLVLGTLLMRGGDYPAAEPILREEVARRQARHGDVHPAVADALNNLGNLLINSGRHDEAEEVYLETLRVRRQLVGDDHPDISLTLNNLAGIPVARGDFLAADTLLSESLRIKEVLVGRENYDVALTLNNLGYVRMEAGELAFAEATFREALEILRRVVGDVNPTVGLALGNLGRAIALQGRVEEAIPYYREALEVREAVHGPRSMQVAWRATHLAVAFEEVGELDEAEALYRRSVAIREEIYEGEDHFEVARGLRPLGALLLKRGEVDEALRLLERAEAIFAVEPGRVAADLERTREDLARARAAAAAF